MTLSYNANEFGNAHNAHGSRANVCLSAACLVEQVNEQGEPDQHDHSTRQHALHDDESPWPVFWPQKLPVPVSIDEVVMTNVSSASGWERLACGADGCQIILSCPPCQDALGRDYNCSDDSYFGYDSLYTDRLLCVTVRDTREKHSHLGASSVCTAALRLVCVQ